MPRPKFTEYHANAIAKEIRELFPIYDPIVDRVMTEFESSWYSEKKDQNMARRGVLSALALSLAHRIKEDGVDHLKFLERCSPDNDRFPITELWEDEENESSNHS